MPGVSPADQASPPTAFEVLDPRAQSWNQRTANRAVEAPLESESSWIAPVLWSTGHGPNSRQQFSIAQLQLTSSKGHNRFQTLEPLPQ